MLQLKNCIGGFFTHVFDSILISEPISTLNGVIHVPPPIVFTHITKCGADATLRCHSVTSCGEYFCNTCGSKASLCKTKGCTQPCSTCTNYHNIIIMIYKLIFIHQASPKKILSNENPIIRIKIK